jgi:hypothetical protein
MPEDRTITRAERDRRIAEIDEQLKPVREQLHALAGERQALVSANDREDWPDGPFTLHYFRYGGRYTDEHDTPQEALGAARYISDSGEGAPDKITDRNGRTIYELGGYPNEPAVDGYPVEVVDDA